MDHNLEGFPVDEGDGEEAGGPVDEQVNLNPAADKKERRKDVQKHCRDKKKAEIEQMKKRITELELSASKLNGRNEENEKELNHWRQLSNSLVTAVRQIESQSKLSIQLVQQSQQMSSLLGKILLQLPQLQQQQSHHPVLDNLGTPNQENNPNPLQDPWHHQALPSPSMNDQLDNIDIGSNIELPNFNPDDYILLEDGLQTYQLDPPQDHKEECVDAKLLGHGNKSLGKKRAASSDDPVLPVDQSRFAKLPKLSHPSGFGNSYVCESSKPLASDFSDPFSIANCMRELNKVKGLDSAKYQKAMINFGDYDYRVKFILMREDFRKDWLSSYEAM